MLCRLHLAAPRRSARALWPRAGSLFEELEREMDSLWDLLGEDWRPVANGAAGSHEMLRSSAAANSGSPFAVTQDMAGFDPQELVVKLIGEKVVLTGKKATRTPDGPFRYELFRREWDVPETVDRERLSCSISSEGHLRIEAPASGPPARTVPIAVDGAGNAGRPEPETTVAGNGRAQG